VVRAWRCREDEDDPKSETIDLWSQGKDAPGRASHHSNELIVCVDGHRQWRNAKNIWQNAAIRSGIGAPARWLRNG
jgi:hypothetical protein